VLWVELPERELFDDEKSEFTSLRAERFQIEHSLVSLSKWESKWCKPFLGKQAKTTEETLDYIRCMTISQNVNQAAYSHITSSVLSEIEAYIQAPMTATWFRDQGRGGSQEVVTAEIIYFWMISHSIPMECQKWHLNRLLTLIRVCSLKSQSPKKMGRREGAESRSALNAARKAQLNTKG